MASTYSVSGSPIDPKLDERFAPAPRLPVSQWSANKEAAATAARAVREGRYSGPDRTRNVALAKSDGTFDALRDRFNANNRDRVMDENGNIVVTGPVAAAQNAAAPAAPAATAAPSRLPAFTPAEPISAGTAGFSASSASSLTPTVPAGTTAPFVPNASLAPTNPVDAGRAKSNDEARALNKTIGQSGFSAAATGLRGLAVNAIPRATDLVTASQANARLAALATSVPVNSTNFASPTVAKNAGARIVNASAMALERANNESTVARRTFQQIARRRAVDQLGTAALRGASRANAVGSALYEGNKVLGKALSNKDTGDLTAAEAISYALTGQTPEGIAKDDVAPQDAASARAFDKLMSARRARANTTDPNRASKIDAEIVKRTTALREEMANRNRPDETGVNRRALREALSNRAVFYGR